MFLVLLEYVKPVSEADRFMDSHRAFLKQYRDSGALFLAARKKPRTGGVLIIDAPDREALEKILAQDSFYQEKIAHYTVIEFEPSMAAPEWSSVLSDAFRQPEI